jgi:hypothetical protein
MAASVGGDAGGIAASTADALRRGSTTLRFPSAQTLDGRTLSRAVMYDSRLQHVFRRNKNRRADERETLSRARASSGRRRGRHIRVVFATRRGVDFVRRKRGDATGVGPGAVAVAADRCQLGVVASVGRRAQQTRRGVPAQDLRSHGRLLRSETAARESPQHEEPNHPAPRG